MSSSNYMLTGQDNKDTNVCDSYWRSNIDIIHWEVSLLINIIRFQIAT